MAGYRDAKEEVGGVALELVRGGSGPALLVLHDELGFPGWMKWNDLLGRGREQIIPHQPGFGRTERQDWMMSYRDLAGFYARWLRESGRTPIDVLAFSAGAFIAAEMAACDPALFRRMVLVGPLGIKPEKGFIFDFLAVTVRSHVLATVARQDAPEFGEIYGGEMTPEQFERFEDARSETARLGWEPFMHNPSLPHLLLGVANQPTLLLRGTEDRIAPRDCIDQYTKVLENSRIVEFPGVGHRPEIEDSAAFLAALTDFLGD